MATAISAAATTKIRNTSTAPAEVPVCCAKVTRLRFTAFSMSSMHISITRRFRRMMTPRNPSANIAIESPRRSWSLSMVLLPRLDHGDRGDDGGQKQHRGELEVEPVLVEEGDG